MPSVGYAGKSYPIIPEEKMMPSEIDAIERATGLTLQKIRRMGATCVCEHGKKAHTHNDDAGEPDTEDTSCTECDCERHAGDVPMRVNTAFAWVSVKRGNPTVRFTDFDNAPISDWEVEEQDDEDPTVPPLEAESPTSEPVTE
jgi:hypothetical protein